MYHLELFNNLQLSILRVPGGDSGCTHDAGYNRYSELYPVNYSSPVSILAGVVKFVKLVKFLPGYYILYILDGFM